MIVGCRLNDGALGVPWDLSPELRSRLTEPGTIVVDESDLERLGISGIGATAEISGRHVRVVGLVHGVRGLASAYVFCSVHTARSLLYLRPDQSVYFLGRCRTPADAARVVDRFRHHSDLTAYTSAEFSLRSRMYWLVKTKAGLALGWTAILGLVVGAVMTGQTLYAATAANLREYAVLRALGIPRWRLGATVAEQSFLVGLTGAILGIPAILAMSGVADMLGIRVILPGWLLTGTVAVTLLVSLLSGLAALRLLMSIDPAVLLR
jgi:putative ABC transport system permease protein